LPRSAAGRTREKVAFSVRPKTRTGIYRDSAGNEFMTAAFRDVAPKQEVCFDFEATYQYDCEAIMQGRQLSLGPTPMPKSWPSNIARFLRPGFHIESDAPEIAKAAEQFRSIERLDTRARSAIHYAARHVRYDTAKRDNYFGGKEVYADAWEMWQGALATLKRGMGCCPDSAELKIAVLRAAGVPARTAVHSGHLYSEFYVPGRGWVTDGPMYNIPLVRSPGPGNCAYFSWEPKVPVRCSKWRGRVEPFGQIQEAGGK